MIAMFMLISSDHYLPSGCPDSTNSMMLKHQIAIAPDPHSATTPFYAPCSLTAGGLAPA
jgi:hypothetical protein